MDFLQGAVYSWCNNREKEIFTSRTFVAGLNYYWQGTPLYPLFEKHKKQGASNDEAVDAAGKELGRLLKIVIANDKREFHTRPGFQIREYFWTGRENNGDGWENRLEE